MIVGLASVSILAILAALMGALVYYGAEALVRFIADPIGRSGIPGSGTLANIIRTGVVLAQASVYTLVNAGAGIVHAFIVDPLIAIHYAIDEAVSFVEELAKSTAWISTVKIPALISEVKIDLFAAEVGLAARITATYNTLHHYTYWAYTSAKTYAHAVWVKANDYSRALYNDTIKHVRAQITAANAYAFHVWAEANAHSDRLYHEATAYADSAAAAATTYAHSLYKAAVADTTRDVAAAEAQAKAYTATALAATAGAITDGLVKPVEAVWGEVADATTGAITAAEGGLAGVTAGLRSIAGVNVGDLAGVGALAGATALTLTRFLRDCGVPNCRNLSGIGRDLQSLFAFAEDGALIALLAAMITDPAGTATEVEDVLGPLARDAVTATRTMIGI